MFNRSLVAFSSVAIALVAAAPAFAARPDIVIPKGQTTVASIPEGVDRIVVGDDSVAQVVVLPGGQQILINGKSPGFTNFIVFLAHGGFRNYRLEVLQAGRDEQIAVRVKVLEVSRRKLGTVGVRWSDSVGWSESTPSAPFKFGLPVRTSLLDATLNTLAQQRDVKVLAEPTLVVQNDQKASFLDGGELPIPIANNSGGGVTYTIDWKQYGVKLDATPHLEGDNSITMDLRPEVSSIDQENAIKLQNLSVPAIATRWASTTVQLQGGQSIVIAGLLQNNSQSAASKLPWLGDIPFLGYLFGANDYDDQQSELVFVVSPSVVTPGNVVPEQNYGTLNNPPPVK
ncbi:MAG TPA: pilus assembly protein N-terminal domain-containing protein [Oscillatoriaceae cyanobacterium]